LKTINIIGSGFSGLSAAAYLAKEGHDVHIYEMHEMTGGRARQFKAEGFTFDMGPSWYWMPDIFERFFSDFGYQASDFYDLRRLEPSYRVFFEDSQEDIPAHPEELYAMFERLEPGSADKLRSFLKSAKYKYDVGISEFVEKPSLSATEFLDIRILSSAMKLNMFSSLSKEVRASFKNPKLIELLEFPVLFLGATPQKIPALYSLMNYADLILGTWYPMGGMYEIVKAMTKVAEKQGVKIHLNAKVEQINTTATKAESLQVNGNSYASDITISSADYHHTEQQLIHSDTQRNYSLRYWNKRVMAPSSLLFYLGIDKKLKNIKHHNLFFDKNFGVHAREIYEDPQWPSDPLFYVCCPSQTDNTVAPEGYENIFMLMPLAPGIEDNDALRSQYFDLIMDRLEKRTGQKIKPHIIFKKSFCIDNFKEDYHAFKGNAYGLANTLTQTAILKPRIKNKKLKNLYYTGQLTVPGPGVPPSIISGRVVANQIITDLT